MKVIIGIISVIAVYSFLLGGCTSERTVDVTSQQLQTKAVTAYEKGLGAIFREATLEIDALWALKEVYTLNPDKDLKAFIDEQILKIDKHPSLCLVKENAPRTPLPLNQGSGIKRFSNFVKAPFGLPEERALSYIEAFLATEESGYILTHQFFVLIWAEEMGLSLPKNILDKKQKILQRILREQRSAKSFFSDLYAERTAILLHWSNPKAEDADRWINVIIDAQQESGNWKVEPFLVTYDNQTVVFNTPSSHTTTLSLLALQAYIQQNRRVAY